jgi:divalent metal cation (Fe/Co/Zn/Cd) transporter
MTRTRLQLGLRATLVGLTVNGLLAITKLVAGLLGHSNALMLWSPSLTS